MCLQTLFTGTPHNFSFTELNSEGTRRSGYFSLITQDYQPALFVVSKEKASEQAGVCVA